jgi:hypothetical protein
MRPWPLLLFLLLVAGCGDTLWRNTLDGLVDAVAPIVTPLEDLAEPEGRALRLWIGGRSTPAVLLQALGERRIWRTAFGIVVATEGGRVTATAGQHLPQAGGRVTATAGLRQMLAATRFEGPDPLSAPAALLDQPAEARRLVDLMDADREPEGMRFGISLACRLRAERTADAEVLLVSERCRTRGSLGFTNRFWVEAEGGGVLRAEQWVGPRVPMLVVEFLAPAG